MYIQCVCFRIFQNSSNYSVIYPETMAFLTRHPHCQLKFHRSPVGSQSNSATDVFFWQKWLPTWITENCAFVNPWAWVSNEKLRSSYIYSTLCGPVESEMTSIPEHEMTSIPSRIPSRIESGIRQTFTQRWEPNFDDH